MENKTKGKKKMFKTMVDILNIAVTIIGIVVTCFNIIQTTRENNRHQKSNRDFGE